MAIIGLNTNTSNPIYSISDFVFWMPNFKKYMQTEDGIAMFNNLYPIADDRILYSVFGKNWKFAMSLCIAHYAWLIASQMQTPSGDDLSSIFGGGVVSGVLASASIGDFSKSYSLEYTMLTSEDAFFWNQSKWGQMLYAMFKQIAIPTIFVVTNTKVPGSSYGSVADSYEVINSLPWITENCTARIENNMMTITFDDGFDEASVTTVFQALPTDRLQFDLYGNIEIKLDGITALPATNMNGRTLIAVSNYLSFDSSKPIEVKIIARRTTIFANAKVKMEILR